MKTFVAVIALASLGALEIPQSIRDAPRGNGSAGVVRGVVVGDDVRDPRPIALATVRLMDSDDQDRFSTTDEMGRFEFRGLDAGDFVVEASKPGYIRFSSQASASVGARRKVTLESGQEVSVSLKLSRGATISGTIHDLNNLPAADVYVRLLQYEDRPDGSRTITKPGLDEWRGYRLTDQLGEFRFYGLPIGEYYVAAFPSANGGTLTNLERALSSPQGLQYSEPTASQAVSYAPVFYPGTPDAGLAAPLNVKSSDERIDVDLSLLLVPSFSVEGMFSAEDGRRLQAIQGSLIPNHLSATQSALQVRPDANGHFAVTGVRPGDYSLVARAGESQTAMVTAPLWGSVNISVSNQNIQSLNIRLSKGVTVSGSVVFGSHRPTGNIDYSGIVISLLAVSPDKPVAMSTSEMRTDADGRFAFGSVPAGRYWINLRLPNRGAEPWALQSLVVGAEDVTDRLLEVGATGDVDNAVVTLTTQPIGLAGKLVDGSGQPLLAASAILFPVDGNRRTMPSRSIRLADSRHGDFSFSGLIPGTYFLCGVANASRSQLSSPAFLESLIPICKQVVLSDGLIHQTHTLVVR